MAVERLLGIHRARESRPLTILNGLQGRLVPGRLTLLLGPPSCGKSTFMRAITGRLIPAHGKLSGEVRYNGHALDELNVRRTAAYVDQFDNHDPNLTVRETLDFAHACQTGPHGARFDVPAALAAQRLISRATADANGHNGNNGDHTYNNVHSTYSSQLSTTAGSSTGNGNSQNDNSNGGFLKALLSPRQEKHLLQQAAPEDEFESLLRQAWGTRVRVDIVMSLLGLSHCADTLVGDALMRGISGGERKRLTSAEMLVGPCNVVVLDEMSTGLDSATLFTVVRWLSQASRALQLTMLVSLLQPPPEVFGLFDDVILMAEGRVLYHGPVPDVVPHFRSVGLDCPDRKDVPSFLLEITTPAGQREFAGAELRSKFNLPPPGVDPFSASRAASALPSDSNALLPSLPSPEAAAALAAANASTASGGAEAVRIRPKSLLVSLEEMEEAFWTKSTHGVKMAGELRESAAAPPPGGLAPPLVPRHEYYALSPWEAIAAVTRRQTTLAARDKVLIKGRIVQTIILGLITGSLFYDQGVSMNASRTIFGAAFMAMLFMSFAGFLQIPLTMELKKVWYKHRSAAFYPAYAQGIALATTQLPISAIEAAVFSLIIYFMVGFYMQPGYFFTFFVVMVSASMSTASLFRFLGCVCPTMVIANAAAGVSFVVLTLTSGFAILHYSIPPWAIWAYWISPFAYALRCLVVNEMVSPKWQNVPAPPGMPPGLSLGDAALQSFDFYTERKWIWIGVGFMQGFFLLFTLGAIISLHVQQPEVPAAQLPDPEELKRARERAQERRARIAERQQSEVKGADTSSKKKEELVVAVRPAGSRISAPGVDVERTSHGKGLVISPSAAALQDFIDISSSLPFTPITLVFQDLKYWVPNPAYSRAAAKKAAKVQAEANQAAIDAHAGGSKDVEAAKPAAAPAPAARAGGPPPTQERLQLLSGITGFNEPGVLLALMGGSGAGKTTLMDVIAGRKTIGTIGGTITVNGHAADPRAWSRVMGYVEQFDIHTPAQTVVEALQFSARLRLPPSFSDQQAREGHHVKSYVEEVLEIVDLLPQMGALVGSPGVSGLSTEARKRLTIAVELVANPSCIFLDEPTSGLDARAASIVMRAVRNVARNGRTVMVTIHQPSIEIFEAFDQLLLIQRGGRTTYFGPVGRNSDDLIAYFSAVPGTPQLPQGFNPATWMLEVTGGSMATVLDRLDVDWPGLYDSSQLAKRNDERARYLVQSGHEDNEPLKVGNRYAMPFGVQTRVLLRKFDRAYWRSPGYNLVRLGTTFLVRHVPFVYAAIYWGEGKVPLQANIGNVQAVMGIMFSSSNFIGMTNLMSVMPVVGYERVVFYRERGASMYNPFAYGIAIALVELPYLLAQTILFVPAIYWMIGFQPTPEAFFYYFIVFLETIAFYTIFGQTLVYITPAMPIAQVVGSGFNFLFNVFNGFVITYPDIPRGWRWMNRAVPATWILYGLGTSQLGDREGVITYGGETVPIPEFMSERFGYSYALRWWVVLILLAYIRVLRVGSVVALAQWNFLRR
ncbi:hypothetical protein GPECTOR_16g622 [Gonium pectorale]|uniref:ABC transporter domain-containing protein n=1 Tax=Gonium pectorale TaxID=33097 RepID=A0A150GKY9_GONPE|nr:hypothetical protein GPECTOR_16g622 [Gonium pectorale]|eukprot:KXZ50448.1 hypothetical protein GPECTOR_16g622 [Gonium pectorale]